MGVLMIRSKIKTETVPNVEEGVRHLISAMERAQLEGVRYASWLLPDGATFMVLLEVPDGMKNPMDDLPAYQELGETLKGSFAEPPHLEQLKAVGSYRLFESGRARP